MLVAQAMNSNVQDWSKKRGHTQRALHDIGRHGVMQNILHTPFRKLHIDAVYFLVISHPHSYIYIFKFKIKRHWKILLSRISIYWKSLIFYPKQIECEDQLPAGYVDCNYTCKDWAVAGDCNRIWEEFSHCGNISGAIKNSCKISCNNCGKHLIWDII